MFRTLIQPRAKILGSAALFLHFSLSNTNVLMLIYSVGQHFTPDVSNYAKIYKWELWLYLKVGQPAIGEHTCHYTRHPCHLAFALFRKGSLFWGLFWPFWALLGPYLYFRVPIFSVLAKIMERMSIQSSCAQQWVNLICLWWVNSCTIIILFLYLSILKLQCLYLALNT